MEPERPNWRPKCPSVWGVTVIPCVDTGVMNAMGFDAIVHRLVVQVGVQLTVPIPCHRIMVGIVVLDCTMLGTMS